MQNDAETDSTLTIPLSSFATDAGHRPQRGRTRVAVSAAGAAVAALALVGAVVAWPGGGRSPAPAQPAAPSATAPATTALDLAAARPAEEVWPDAVVRLPQRLSDGRTFTPKARLDDDRYVGVPVRGNVYEPPVIYDADARRVTELVTEWSRDDTVLGLPAVSVSERTIVMAMLSRSIEDDVEEAVYEVWVAPRSGGSARRRAVFEAASEVSAFGVGDKVFAAVTAKEGRGTTLYRLPAGGSPEQVASAEGVPHSPYGRWFLTGPAAGSPDALPSAPATFLDVVTGESRTTTVLDGLTDIVCSPETCVGRDDAGMVAYRFDGTNPTRITGVVPSRHQPVITETGRFVLLRSDMNMYLWDCEKAVVVPVTDGSSGTGPLPEYRYSDDEQFLIDLSRVP
jgi:hypothetical protein